MTSNWDVSLSNYTISSWINENAFNVHTQVIEKVTSTDLFSVRFDKSTDVCNMTIFVFRSIEILWLNYKLFGKSISCELLVDLLLEWIYWGVYWSSNGHGSKIKMDFIQWFIRCDMLVSVRQNSKRDFGIERSVSNGDY